MNFAGCACLSITNIISHSTISKGVREWNMVKIHFFILIGDESSKWEKGNCCCKCLWYLLSVLVALLAFFGNIIFFALFGMPYELIKCYMEKPILTKEEIQEMRKNNEYEGYKKSMEEIYDLEGWRKQNNMVIFACCCIAFFGWFLQPLYILFYVTYGLLEFYRRVKYIFFYAGMSGGFGGGGGGGGM